MKYAKLKQDYKETIVMYYAEYFGNELRTNENLFKQVENEILTRNFSVAMYRQAIKSGDFEMLHENIIDNSKIIQQQIIKELKGE